MSTDSTSDDLTRDWNPQGDGAPTGLPRALPPVRERIQSLSRYSPLECLGRGGMGEVWAVFDQRLRRRVALKLIRTEQPPEAAAERLLEEAQMTASLAHPSIVPVYDAGRFDDGSVFYTMQEVVGINLREALEAQQAQGESAPVTPHRMIEALASAARALVVAHERGLVHRDIKPDNIVIGANGAVYLVDWGIAAAIRQVGVRARSSGTPGYVAPEVEAGDGVPSESSDVYAFGATLAAVLTGSTARPSMRSPVRLVGLMSVERLLELAHACMHPDPAARLKSASAVVARLDDWMAGDRDQRNRLRRVQQADQLMRLMSDDRRRQVEWVLRCLLDAHGRPTPCTIPLDNGLQEVLEQLDGVVLQRDEDHRWTFVDPLLVEHWAPLRRVAEDTSACALLVQVRAVLPPTGPAGELSEETLLELVRWQARTGAWLHPRQQAAVDEALADRRRRRLYRVTGGVAAVSFLALTAVVLAALYVQSEQARRSATDALAVARAAQQSAEASRLEAVGRASWMEGREWTAMVQLLASHRQRPRGERGLLQRLSSQPDSLRVVPISDAIQWWIDAAPDGQTVAVAGDDGRVRLVEPRTGLVRSVDVFDDMVTYVHFQDDTTVMAMDRRGVRRLITVSTGEAATADPTLIAVSASRELEVLRSEPSSLTLRSTDGTETSLSLDAPVQWAEVSDTGDVVVLTQDGVLYRWSGSSLQARVAGLTGAQNFAVSPSGRRAVVFENTFDPWIVALDAGRRLGRLRELVPDRIHDYQCHFGTTSELLACGTLQGKVVLVDLEDASLRWSAVLSTAEVWQARPSPDGKWVAAATDEGITAVLDARFGSVVARSRESSNRHKSIAWMPDSGSVAIATGDGRALLWTPPLVLLDTVEACRGQRVRGVGADARGDQVSLGSGGQLCGRPQEAWQGSAWVWSTRATTNVLAGTINQGLWMRPRADGSVDRVQVGKIPCDGQKLVASGSVLYAHCTDRSLHRLAGDGVWQRLAGAYSLTDPRSEARVIGVDAETSEVVLLDTAADRVIKRWPPEDLAVADWLGVAGTTDQTFYASTPDGDLWQWALDDGRGAFVDRVGLGRLRLQVSTDGQWLGISDQTGVVEVRSTTEPTRALWRYDSGEDAALKVQFLDDRMVLSDGTASALVVLDRQSGQPLLRLPGLRSASPVLRRADGRTGVALIPENSHHQDLFVLLDEPLDVRPERLLSRTNLRLCPETGEVVPVIPFPSPDSLHAPDGTCPASSAPRPPPSARPD